MLLRRVIKHVSDQNWLAVFIDFSIVVIGIFVGLQVQAWYAELDNRKQERLYLERILADVELSIIENKTTLNYNAAYKDDIWMAFQSLHKCELAEDNRDRFANALFNVGRFIPSSYLMGTVEEMRSAGQFNLITNTEIRDKINQLEQRENLDRILFPSITSRASISMAYVDQNIVVNKKNLGPFEHIRWDELNANFDTLCKDTQLLASITLTRTIRDLYIVRNETAIEGFQKIKATLVQELKKSSFK